jgi:hypothetical protein
MADVITRFKLETTQFDSRLRDTAKALQGIAHQAVLGGKDFDNFSKEAIKSARALGTVQSGATNTKDKLKDLVGSYNDAAKAYNSLTEKAKQGEFGKAMSQSLQQLQQEIKRTKDELYSMGDATKGGGGLFGGGKLDGMLQVFGGNLMTKAAGMGMSLVGELKDMVMQGIELARAGEGVRKAFQRLGRGDILDGLRQATHGTVTDLELMKAAVKFNDFKLPLDELGTMLAFAQQKAKDTGQSVDYMVDSIVTGLGRKSLMILDNLGLSAAEVKEKMKETGDMTKAVGAIIREQMEKAGDYVETAADRATQANVTLQNKMEELGRKFAPVEEASNQLWTSIKIGIMDIVSGPLAKMLNQLTEAGRLKNMLDKMNGNSDDGGNTKVENQLKKLQAIKSAGGSDYIFKSTLSGMVEDYNRQINDLDKKIKNGGKWEGEKKGFYHYESVDVLQRQMDALTVMRNQLQSGAKDISTPVPVQITNTPTNTTPTGGGGGGTTSVNLSPFVTSEGERAIEHQEFSPMMNTADFMEALRKEMGIDGEMTRDWGKEIGQVFADYIADPDKKKRGKNDKKEEKKDDKVMNSMSKLTSGVTGIFSGIEQMGIEIPDGMKQALNAINGLMSIAQSILVVVEAIKGLEAVGLIKLAGGGIVPHAAGGYMIGGNSYSGDNIYAGGAWVNSGELVLNRAQQSTLASQLQGQDKQMHVVGEVQGEKIILVANRTFRRKGQGEIVTW